MPRVKRSVHARKKRRKVLGEAKGYWGLKSKTYTHAKEQLDHSLKYAYRDRKVRKRTMRSLWIIRINAAARQHGLSYNQFVAGCKKAEIELDRKVLAELAVSDPDAFGMIAEQAKSALVAAECWEALGRAGFTRSDAVVTVGGGATTDVGGFVEPPVAWTR